MRSDTFISKIGARSSGAARLWIEDSSGRLSRNGFDGGMQFDAVARPGVGVVIVPDLLGGLTVSRRAQLPLLSVENRWLGHQLPVDEVRVRVSVKNIIVMPRLRLFGIVRNEAETWNVRGLVVQTPAGERMLGGCRPLAMRGAGRINVELDWNNIVFATELIGGARPAAVSLSGDELCQRVAGKFLQDGGFTFADGIWRR